MLGAEKQTQEVMQPGTSRAQFKASLPAVPKALNMCIFVINRLKPLECSCSVKFIMGREHSYGPALYYTAA